MSELFSDIRDGWKDGARTGAILSLFYLLSVLAVVGLNKLLQVLG